MLIDVGWCLLDVNRCLFDISWCLLMLIDVYWCVIMFETCMVCEDQGLIHLSVWCLMFDVDSVNSPWHRVWAKKPPWSGSSGEVPRTNMPVLDLRWKFDAPQARKRVAGVAVAWSRGSHVFRFGKSICDATQFCSVQTCSECFWRMSPWKKSSHHPLRVYISLSES